MTLADEVRAIVASGAGGAALAALLRAVGRSARVQSRPDFGVTVSAMWLGNVRNTADACLHAAELARADHDLEGAGRSGRCAPVGQDAALPADPKEQSSGVDQSAPPDLAPAPSLPLHEDDAAADEAQEWRVLDDSPAGLLKLVRCAVRYATNMDRGKRVAWSVVREVFSVGSTHGAELCKRFGVNPDAMVRRCESVSRATERVAALKAKSGESPQ